MINYLKHIPKIFIKRNALPLYLTYFVTHKCNLKCRHCFFWKEINKNTKELSLDEINKFSETMNNIVHLNLTGGEPFLRNDLSEIVNIFYKNNSLQNIAIPTNGFLTKQILKIVKQILENCPNLAVMISLSLDGLKEQHDKIRGVKGSFNNAMKTYKELSKLRNKYKNLNLEIILSFSSFTQEYIQELYSFAKSLNPNSIDVAFIRGNPRDKKAKSININNYIKICNQIEKDLSSKELIGYTNFSLSSLSSAVKTLKRKIIAKTYKENKFQTRCFAGNLSAVIYSNGDVFPCELLNKKIGNIRDYNYDFKALWLSKNAKSIREYIKKTRCFCTHECNLTTNILFNLRYLPYLIKKTIKLK